MPKLSRGAAGERVQAGINALSTDLLTDEAGTKEEIDALFVSRAAAVAQIVEVTHGKGKQTCDRMASALSDIAAELLGRCGEPFAKLAGVATGKALRSIESELLACEQTLGAKYRGLAVEACAAVDDLALQSREIYADRFEQACATVLPWFTRQAATELLLGGKEDYALALDRILSPTPITATAHSGKGLWWKIPEHAHRVTREAEFAAVNWIRTAAMDQFNRIGDAR